MRKQVNSTATALFWSEQVWVYDFFFFFFLKRLDLLWCQGEMVNDWQHLVLVEISQKPKASQKVKER